MAGLRSDPLVHAPLQDSERQGAAAQHRVGVTVSDNIAVFEALAITGIALVLTYRPSGATGSDVEKDALTPQREPA